MGALIVVVIVVALAGLAVLTIAGRPRSRAEELRRRGDNESHVLSARDRQMDTRWGAWFYGLVFAAGALIISCVGVWVWLSR